MVDHQDLGGDEDTARRVMIRARSIAPCLAGLAPGSSEGKDAIALLKGVLAELPEPGSRRTRSLSRNGTSITFDALDSAFDVETIASLRSLCGVPAATAHPRGSFPKHRPIGRVWPEEYP